MALLVIVVFISLFFAWRMSHAGEDKVPERGPIYAYFDPKDLRSAANIQVTGDLVLHIPGMSAYLTVDHQSRTTRLMSDQYPINVHTNVTERWIEVSIGRPDSDDHTIPINEFFGFSIP